MNTAAAAAAAAAAATTPPGWRQRLRRALGHILKARLVAVFLTLALGTTAVFFIGSRVWFSSGWRELARPLLTDYVDRLAAEIGSPPDLARARALVQRLPLALRIDGPQLQWDSHPDRRAHGPHEHPKAGRSGPPPAWIKESGKATFP